MHECPMLPSRRRIGRYGDARLIGIGKSAHIHLGEAHAPRALHGSFGEFDDVGSA